MSNRTLPAGIDVVCLSGKCRDLMIGSMCVETASDPLWWLDRVGRKLENNHETATEPDSGTQPGNPKPY